MPTRELLLPEAVNMFPMTISLDDIVDDAYQLLGEAVGALLFVSPLRAVVTPKPLANMHSRRPNTSEHATAIRDAKC
jgi:hypothetical protein